MNIGETSQGAAACLAVEGEMTIYRAAELKPVLLDFVLTHATPALDLAGVTEFDSSGAQLLLVARREAVRLGKRLELRGASPAVRDAFTLLGLSPEGECA